MPARSESGQATRRAAALGGVGSTLRRTGAGIGRSTVRGARAAARFTTAGGAGESGLARLIHLQFLVAAGDAAIAVSLAGTLFFALPTDQARPQVAQFLLLTMAPFAVVAPFIGPVLDRFRHGRRWAVGITVALRAFLCWVLADAVSSGSRWVFPAALCCLVASKAFTVTRAAAVPRLLPTAFTLVTANSRISMASVVGAAVGGGMAAGLARLGPAWSLRLAFLIFVGGTVVAILLPPRVDSSVGERDIGGLMAGPDLIEQSPNRLRRRFRSLPGVVLSGLRCATGARLTTGFLTMFLAFLLREKPIAAMSGTLLLGIVVAAAGFGNSLGTLAGHLLQRVRPERIAIAVLCVDAVMVSLTAAFYSIVTVIALGWVAGLCAQLAKLSYDALVQGEVAEVVRTSVFARSETVLQLSWVFGGALGIGLPLIPALGFGVIGGLLFALLGWTLWTVRRSSVAMTA